MNSLLFNRQATLRVQSRRGDFESTAGRPVIEQREYSGLRVAFSIEKSSESTPNQARISVYNMNSDSRSFVEQKGATAELKVGYSPLGLEPTLQSIFSGDAGKVKSERNGADWVTTFELGDAQKKLAEVKFDKSFEKGITLKDAITDVAGSFGLAVNQIEGVAEKTFKSGLTLSGGSKQIMDQLVSDGGAEWSVQDGEVKVIGPQQTTGEEVIIISPQTGLINSPIKRDDGVEFTSLLIPSIRPGRRIEIRSRLVNGVYRVRKVIFSGDTFEGDFNAKVECTEVASA